jgi:small-conductance mechanosensitive channel
MSWDIFFETHLPRIVWTAAAFVVLALVKFTVRKVARRYGAIMGKPRERVRHVRKIIGAMLNVLFVFVIAAVWGVKPQNLVVTLSSALAFFGVAMFAQWSVLSNITAGVVMFFSAPYHVGDAIRIIDKDVPLEAKIEKIGAFYTNLRTDGGELVILPNNLFLQKMVAVRGDADRDGHRR